MNIIELKQNEITMVSGGDTFYTLLYANLASLVALPVANFLLQAYILHSRQPSAPYIQVVKKAALMMLYDGFLKGSLQAYAYISLLGCGGGALVGCCIAYPLSWLGLINID